MSKKEKNFDDVNKLIDEIEERESEKNAVISNTIASRIGEMSELAGTPVTLSVLLNVKKTQKDITFINALIKEVELEQIKAINEAVRLSAEISYNNIRQKVKKAETATNLPSLNENKEVKKIIEQTQNEAVNSFKNEYRTQAFMLRDKKNPKNLIPTKLSEAYQKAVDEATQAIINAPRTYEETGHARNYTTIMRQTVREIAQSGIRVVVVRKDGTKTDKVKYQSEKGRYHTQRLDAAVRRNVLDSVRKVNQAVQDEVGKEIGADGIEITVHSYPAPDHAPVQGHQFYNSEFEKMQNGEDFVDVQNRKYLGFQRPIGMWNCGHFTYPVLVGIFPQTYDDEQLQKILDENEDGYTLPNGKHLTMYQCTQRQRKYEREVRYAKEGKITADAAKDEKLSKKFKAKAAKIENSYRAFSKACGLPIKTTKLYVDGY